MADYFTDRIAEFPGRVQLTAVSGQADVYDMTRAEGSVTEEGTPFNAATFNAIAQDILDKITALSVKLNQTPTQFSGTRNSSFSAGSCTGVYDRVTGIVRLTFGFTSTSNVATGTTLFTIPEDYRPASAMTGTALFGVYTSSGMTTAASACTLNTNGTITQALTSNARSGFGYIEYYLG